MSDEREFRIYVSSKGDQAVFEKIMGEYELERVIPYVRTAYPSDTIIVREVLESVQRVYKPDGETIRFDL